MFQSLGFYAGYEETKVSELNENIFQSAFVCIDLICQGSLLIVTEIW
jgi:hypothetical protein